MTNQLTTALQSELEDIRRQKSVLAAREEAIHHLLGLTSTATVANSRMTRTISRPKVVQSPSRRTIKTPSSLTSWISPQNDQPNTLSMVRQVLRNARGRTMTLPQLIEAIKGTYKLDPAKTLDQMIGRRAAEGKGFYKTENGEFGLTELKVETRNLQGASVIA